MDEDRKFYQDPVRILFDPKKQHYETLVKKNDVMDVINDNQQRKRSAYDSDGENLSKDLYEVQEIEEQGDCFFLSILKHCPEFSMTGERTKYLTDKKVSFENKDENEQKILFLRNKLADHVERCKDNLKAVFTHYELDKQIKLLRNLGKFDFLLFDHAVKVACDHLPVDIGKQIRIYQDYGSHEFVLRKTDVNGDDGVIDNAKRLKSYMNTNGLVSSTDNVDLDGYDDVEQSDNDDPETVVDQDDMFRNLIEKYENHSNHNVEVIEQIRDLYSNTDTDKRKIFEKLSQELNKTNERSVEPCENTDTMASIKRLVSEINEKNKEKYKQNLQDLNYIVSHTNSKTDLKCELLMEFHVKKNLYDTWFNRLNGQNDARTDDLSKFGIRGRRLLQKNLQGELYIKVDDQEIMIMEDNSENSEDIVDVYKITIYEENPNVNDKYSQLSSFLPENVNSTILKCSDWKIHEEFNPEKFNKDTKSEETLQTLIGILANQSEKRRIKTKSEGGF